MVSNQSPRLGTSDAPEKRQDPGWELLPETLPPPPLRTNSIRGSSFSVLFVKEVLFTQSSHVCGSPDPISRQGLSTRRTGLGTQRDSRGALSPARAGHSDLETSTGWRTEGRSTRVWLDDLQPCLSKACPSLGKSSTLGSQERSLPLRK